MSTLRDVSRPGSGVSPPTDHSPPVPVVIAQSVSREPIPVAGLSSGEAGEDRMGVGGSAKGTVIPTGSMRVPDRIGRAGIPQDLERATASANKGSILDPLRRQEAAVFDRRGDGDRSRLSRIPFLSGGRQQRIGQEPEALDDSSSRSNRSASVSSAISGSRRASPDEHPSVIQTIVSTRAEDGLTKPMLERFKRVGDIFLTNVVASSYLAGGESNQVLLHGVSKATHQVDHFGQTSLYLCTQVGYAGYDKNDYGKFKEFWGLDRSVPHTDKTAAVRLVIAVNMTRNNSDEELYATMLHEWHAHAVKWEQTVRKIRGVADANAPEDAVQSTPAEREKQEHIEFARTTTEMIRHYVEPLELSAESATEVINKIIGDRNRHDETTGEILTDRQVKLRLGLLKDAADSLLRLSSSVAMQEPTRSDSLQDLLMAALQESPAASAPEGGGSAAAADVTRATS